MFSSSAVRDEMKRISMRVGTPSTLSLCQRSYNFASVVPRPGFQRRPEFLGFPRVQFQESNKQLIKAAGPADYSSRLRRDDTIAPASLGVVQLLVRPSHHRLRAFTGLADRKPDAGGD